MTQAYHPDAAPWNEDPTPYVDLGVRGASSLWQQIRWALFVFPDITDVAPTEDRDVVRVFYEGTRPYPYVWTVELRQRGFDVEPVPEGPGQRPRPRTIDGAATAGVANAGKSDAREQAASRRATPGASDSPGAASSLNGSGLVGYPGGCRRRSP